MREYRFVTEYEGLAPGTIRVSDDSLEAFSRELANFVLTELKKPELNRLARIYPVSKAEREKIICLSERLMNDGELFDYAAEAILDCLNECDTICPEGMLRFRMPLVTERWALALESAAEELIFDRERSELLRLLGALFAAFGETGVGGEARLVIYPDGSGVLAFEDGLTVECSRASEAPICAVICALSPTRLTVYDLSGTGRGALKRSIRSLMGERVAFFEADGKRRPNTE